MSDHHPPEPRPPEFHYSREERLSRSRTRHASSRPAGRSGLIGYLRGNRIFLFLLADVLLLCLGVVAVRHLRETRIELAGFALVLSAKPSPELVETSLTVRRLRPRGPASPGSVDRVFVRFSFPGDEAEMYTSGELPRRRESPLVLRGILLQPEGEPAAQVLAEVEIGSARRVLALSLPR